MLILILLKFPAQLTEDFCGVEPITHPPILRETRPPPIVDPYKVEKAYHRFDSILWGSKFAHSSDRHSDQFTHPFIHLTAILAILFLLLVIMGILTARHLSRHKGEYLTQEDKGADVCDDPDEAVINSATGHQVTKRKEWFI